jgi:hypothetical protein
MKMHFRPIRHAFCRNLGVVASALVSTCFVVSFCVAAGTFTGATILCGSALAPGLLAVLPVGPAPAPA